MRLWAHENMWNQILLFNVSNNYQNNRAKAQFLQNLNNQIFPDTNRLTELG